MNDCDKTERDGLEKEGEWLTEMNEFTWIRRQDLASVLTWFEK